MVKPHRILYLVAFLGGAYLVWNLVAGIRMLLAIDSLYIIQNDVADTVMLDFLLVNHDDNHLYHRKETVAGGQQITENTGWDNAVCIAITQGASDPRRYKVIEGPYRKPDDLFSNPTLKLSVTQMLNDSTPGMCPADPFKTKW